MQQEQSALQVVCLAAQTILECSGEIYRAEDTALRLCRAFHFQDAEILCFPTGFTLSARGRDGVSLSRTLRIRERTMQLDRLDDVNRISRAVSDGVLDAEGALRAIQALRVQPAPARLRLILAYAVSAAFFSLMFGGGPGEFALCLACGALLQAVLPLASRFRAPPSLTSLLGGILSAASALVAIHFFGGNQEAVISGTIMPLLPGLAMTNAVRDTMRGDLIAGMARGTEALLSAVMLAVGVAFVLVL